MQQHQAIDHQPVFARQDARQRLFGLFGAVCLHPSKPVAYPMHMHILIPGAENSWYTASMLEAEVKRRLQHVKDPGIDYLEYITNSMRYTQAPLSDILFKLSVAERDLNERERRLGADTYNLTQKIKQETERIQHVLKLIEVIEQQHDSYEAFLDELEALFREVMSELAGAPIEEASGLMVPVPTELSSAEVEAQISNELKQLKKFHARVHTTDGEATISTLPPAAGISQQELLALIEEIKQRNLHKGYIRLRREVEREIASRQQRPPDEPSTLQSPPPHPPASPSFAPVKRRKKVI